MVNTTSQFNNKLSQGESNMSTVLDEADRIAIEMENFRNELLELNPLEEIPSYIQKVQDPTLFEAIMDKYHTITTKGFTLDEFEKAMMIICLIRFIVYSIRYNPITSFKICGVGALSCILWTFDMNDCVNSYNKLFKYFPLLQRMAIEYDTYERQIYGIVQQRLWNERMLVSTGQKSPYHFEWLGPLFEMMPQKYKHLTDPAFEYIKKDLFYDWQTFYKKFLRPELPELAFVFFMRLGKKYVPYHTRWHASMIVTLSFFTPLAYGMVGRANRMIYQTLLPERRYQEVEDLQLWIGCFIFFHFTCIFYAMLHAIFSQYFYVPFIVQNAELHVGRRPGKSLYSGGYTAWQDETFRFFDPNFRELSRLWWGWLGRGVTKEHKRRRPKRRRPPKWWGKK